MKQADIDTEVFPVHAQAPQTAIAPGEILIGVVAGIDNQGQPLVDFPENHTGQPLSAISTMSITVTHVGRSVALLFAKGDPKSPVIMGLIHSPLQDLIMAYDANGLGRPVEEVPASTGLKVDEVTVDGKKIVLEGREEVVIKCGEASITLTKAGKILIHGNYVLNHSTGVNRITGGSVQVN